MTSFLLSVGWKGRGREGQGGKEEGESQFKKLPTAANMVGASEAICEFHIVERGYFDGKLKRRRFGKSRG